MKRKALFVGVNEYADNQIRNLRCSVRDAHSMNDLFEELGYETKCLENPGKGNVFQAVSEMTAGLSTGDQFLFYFAGHGFTDSGQHLLFCADDRHELLRFHRAGIPFDLLELETRKDGYDRVFLLDACQSDFLAGARGGDATTRDLIAIGDMVPSVEDAPGSFYVLRSCSKYEHALEIESRSHGLFTLAMIDVLRQSRRSGTELLFNDALRETIREKMHVIARGAGMTANQTPESDGRGALQVLISGHPAPAKQHVAPQPSPSCHQPIATPPTLVLCPVCGKKNHPENTFKCRACGRDNLCLRHQDEATFLCAECTAAQRKVFEEAERKAEVERKACEARKAAARKDGAADQASTAAAEVLPDILAERVETALGPFWQQFRIIHGVQIRDVDDRSVPLAGLVASDKGIFVGVSIESLPSSIRNSLPPDNPAWPFAQSVADHCGIPLKCFLAALVVPEAFRVPGTELPPWAVRESDLVDAMLNSKAEEYPDWLGKRQDIIRKLEKLPMSSEGAEKNALIHFKADIPEWEDGAELIEKVETPSPQLIQLARQAEKELERAGKRSVADNVRKWLEKKGAAKARPVTSLKTGNVKKLVQAGEVEGEHKKIQLWKDGPYWAETNIGAEHPWESGYYFWWGDTLGYKWENGAWVASDGSSSGFSFKKTNIFSKLFGKKDNTPTMGKDSSTLLNEGWITQNYVLASKHDAAHVKWGGKWRMPTIQDLEKLNSKCKWTWEKMNRVSGYVIRGKGDYASASIFLPCAGYGDGTSLNKAGSYGYYWSSDPALYDHSWSLCFNSRHHDTNYIFYYDLFFCERNFGFPVRPVQSRPRGTE